MTAIQSQGPGSISSRTPWDAKRIDAAARLGDQVMKAAFRTNGEVTFPAILIALQRHEITPTPEQLKAALDLLCSLKKINRILIKSGIQNGVIIKAHQRFKRVDLRAYAVKL